MRPTHPAFFSETGCYHPSARSSHSPYPGPAHFPQPEYASTHGEQDMPALISGVAREVGQASRVHQPTSRLSWGHAASGEYVTAVVRNTFVDVVDHSETPAQGLTKSASDSELSKSSEERIHFWLPSLSSSSGEAGAGAVSWGASSFSGPSGLAGAPASDACQFQADPQSEPSGQLVGLAYHADPNLPEVPSELDGPRSDNVGSLGSGQADAERPQPSASTSHEDIPLVVQQIHGESGVPIAELMELHGSFDLSLVPRKASTGVLLSVGSIKHAEGTCSPCMFHATKSCRKGVTCLFCHWRHRDYRPKRFRPPKRKRDKMKAAASRGEVVQDAESSSEEEEEHVPSAPLPGSAFTGHADAVATGSGQHRSAGQANGPVMTGKQETKVRL